MMIIVRNHAALGALPENWKDKEARMAESGKIKEKGEELHEDAAAEAGRLADKARDIVSRASSDGRELWDGASARARALTSRARREASDLGETMRQNSTTTTTALTTFGLVCFGLGLAIGSALKGDRR